MHCFYILLLYINFIYIQQGVIKKEKRSVTFIEKIIQEIYHIVERKRSSGFRRIFPVGQSLTLTYANLSKSTQYLIYIFRWSVCNATKKNRYISVYASFQFIQCYFFQFYDIPIIHSVRLSNYDFFTFIYGCCHPC